MARAFVAVLPPEPVLDAVAGVVDRLRADCPAPARWAPREQWHLTLRFLGDHVDLDVAAGALTAIEFEAFDVQLGGVGAFSRPSHANVLWIGVAANCAPVTALAASVHEATSAVVPSDDTPFRAHLTVARFDRPRNVRQLVHHPDPSERIGPAWTVQGIALMESVLGRGPARHRIHTTIAARSRPRPT